MLGMAYKYREEIVGKRFLSVSSHLKLRFSRITEWAWRSGFIRAVSHKDCKHPELTILIEFDDTEWTNRDWFRLYMDNVFAIFLVENTIVWTPRTYADGAKNCFWPSLTFKSLVDNAGVAESRLQPVEYLVDQELGFVDYGDTLQYQDQDGEFPPPNAEYSEVHKAIQRWTEYQDGQKILVTTPSVLIGYRVEVYRVEGTTQWYTAVIVSYNDITRELTLTDDTVLEEHYEDPCLVQMTLIGEGVVESIIKGESAGITPRRRACNNNDKNNNTQENANQGLYCTRTRSRYYRALSSTSYSQYSTGVTAVTRRSRRRLSIQIETTTSTSEEFQPIPSTSSSAPDTVYIEEVCQPEDYQSDTESPKKSASGASAPKKYCRKGKRKSRKRRKTVSKKVVNYVKKLESDSKIVKIRDVTVEEKEGPIPITSTFYDDDESFFTDVSQKPKYSAPIEDSLFEDETQITELESVNLNTESLSTHEKEVNKLDNYKSCIDNDDCNNQTNSELLTEQLTDSDVNKVVALITSHDENKVNESSPIRKPVKRAPKRRRKRRKGRREKRKNKTYPKVLIKQEKDDDTFPNREGPSFDRGGQPFDRGRLSFDLNDSLLNIGDLLATPLPIKKEIDDNESPVLPPSSDPQSDGGDECFANVYKLLAPSDIKVEKELDLPELLEINKESLAANLNFSDCSERNSPNWKENLSGLQSESKSFPEVTTANANLLHSPLEYISKSSSVNKDSKTSKSSGIFLRSSRGIIIGSRLREGIIFTGGYPEKLAFGSAFQSTSVTESIQTTSVITNTYQKAAVACKESATGTKTVTKTEQTVVTTSFQESTVVTTSYSHSPITSHFDLSRSHTKFSDTPAYIYSVQKPITSVSDTLVTRSLPTSPEVTWSSLNLNARSLPNSPGYVNKCDEKYSPNAPESQHSPKITQNLIECTENDSTKSPVTENSSELKSANCFAALNNKSSKSSKKHRSKSQTKKHSHHHHHHKNESLELAPLKLHIRLTEVFDGNKKIISPKIIHKPVSTEDNYKINKLSPTDLKSIKSCDSDLSKSTDYADTLKSEELNADRDSVITSNVNQSVTTSNADRKLPETPDFSQKVAVICKADSQPTVLSPISPNYKINKKSAVHISLKSKTEPKTLPVQNSIQKLSSNTQINLKLLPYSETDSKRILVCEEQESSSDFNKNSTLPVNTDDTSIFDRTSNLTSVREASLSPYNAKSGVSIDLPLKKKYLENKGKFACQKSSLLERDSGLSIGSDANLKSQNTDGRISLESCKSPLFAEVIQESPPINKSPKSFEVHEPLKSPYVCKEAKELSLPIKKKISLVNGKSLKLSTSLEDSIPSEVKNLSKESISYISSPSYQRTKNVESTPGDRRLKYCSESERRPISCTSQSVEARESCVYHENRSSPNVDNKLLLKLTTKKYQKHLSHLSTSDTCLPIIDDRFNGNSPKFKPVKKEVNENIAGGVLSNYNREVYPSSFGLSINVKQEFHPNIRTHCSKAVIDCSHVKKEHDDNQFIEHSDATSWKYEIPERRLINSNQSSAPEQRQKDRNIITNLSRHNYEKKHSFESEKINLRNFDGSYASSKDKNIYHNTYFSDVSELVRTARSREHSIISHSSLSPGQKYTIYDRRTLSPRRAEISNIERHRSGERKHASQVHNHESVSLYSDRHLMTNNPGISQVDCLRRELMHPTGITHPVAAAAAAAAVYPRVANIPQHNRAPGAPMPPSQLGPYSLSSHLIPPPHVAAPSGTAAPPGSHMDQHAAAMHSQAYRHLMSQHPLMPPQYGGSSGPHVGLDLMWQQKYPNHWMMAQYEEGLRLERERALAQERERRSLERTFWKWSILRDRRDDLDREKAEREKAEKDRQERERMQKEQQRKDRERLDREERGRAQREAVQQHFEESLRMIKQQQLQPKPVGWNPMSGLPLGKSQPGVGSSSPTGSQSVYPPEHEREKIKEKERATALEVRMRQDHERWLAAVQRNDPSAAHSSYPQNYSAVEAHNTSGQVKQDAYTASRSSPHGSSTAHHSSKSGIVPSPVSVSIASNVPSQHKPAEANFSLYGYQPFQHTYISQAQLKAREETKGSSSVPSVKQAAVHIKQEKETFESPPPGSNRVNTHALPNSSKQLKLVHQSQDRSSPMYQPLVGSGGAFKPYEFSNSSPAPPAHQSSSSPNVAGRVIAPQFLHSQQDQPQNLVKSDHKGSHDQTNSPTANHLKYESQDVQQNMCTPPCSNPSYTPPFSSKSVSPSNTNYSYSLIQQGLVPNPLYIAATRSGSSPSLNASVTSSCYPQSKTNASSPPITQQFPRAASGAGISSGTPVCRSNSISYQKNIHNYSAAANNSPANSGRICPQEAHSNNRLQVQANNSNPRSPSPAHLYGSSPNIHAGSSNAPHHSRGPNSSPRLNSSINPSQIQMMHRLSSQPGSTAVPSQFDLVDSQVLPLNLQGNSATSKRKVIKEEKDINKKRLRINEDHLLPPQLHPQIIYPTSDNSIQQMGTPPHLVSNSCPPPVGPFSGENILPSPNISEASLTQSSIKCETSAMPKLHCSSAGGSNTSAFIEQYQSFPTSTQENLGFFGKHKMPNKVSVDCSNMDANSSSTRTICNTSSSSIAQGMKSANIKLEKDESYTNSSYASCVNSTAVPNNNIGGSVNHPKLKKAWLQRHSENEDKKVPLVELSKVFLPSKANEGDDNKEGVSPSSKPSFEDESNANIKTEGTAENNETENIKTESQPEEDSTTSASETDDAKHVKRKLRINRKQGCPSPSNKKSKNNSVENATEELSKKETGTKKKIMTSEKETSAVSKKRGRKTKGRNAVSEEDSKKKSLKSPEKPSLAQLKKSGESFLQDGPCCEVAPRLPRCRECRMTPHQRSKKMPNIFCRFFYYRKLRYGKNGTLVSAGFSEPADATEDDLKLWLPPNPMENSPTDTQIETSKFLLTHVGDQFCDLVEMEKEAQSFHSSENATITWKRVVQGVREMCDVCEMTLFNIHWVCHKCGFVVCIDCYKTRHSGDDSISKDKDDYNWLLCTNRQPHEPQKLMITQIIAGTALWDVNKLLHEVRRKWNIPTYCSCSTKDGEQDGKHSANGIVKLMSAVTDYFSPDRESNPVNGTSESSHSKKVSKVSSVNGVKQDDCVSGYSSESGGSPLSWLADVALNSSNSVKDEKDAKNVEETEDKQPESQSNQAEAVTGSDDERNENFSTLRELLIRPMGKMAGKICEADSSSQKTLTSTLDEVISCVIEQRVRKPDRKNKEKQLLYFSRKQEVLRSGRELLPIRSCTITESSLLYPETPHFWLGSGKILLLTDPYHSGNTQMFQEQWKRGQPVIVSEVGQRLDKSLWTPESFHRDFGDVKIDFLNCLCGTLVQNQQMKKFWEGFDNTNKRMKDESGNVLILKLKDWPPSEEFSDLLPARHADVMKVLPIPHYTNRDGMFNMASRLPDCFVRPDLGPRMFSAYGLATFLHKGSSNLHLDITDSVNILVYVGGPNQDADNLDPEILEAIDESGCDSLMKKRALENNGKIGAIWHVYNARDADKIRDLLNKVAEEQGAKCDPHHDPIHNQEWYLDSDLRNRLAKEYGVKSYVIIQNNGDAIFIPAGSPHQVRNLQSCIKISEDFVSPESASHSFFLTQEIRNLPDGPNNQEDKIHVKNIIYHAVKDALALLQSCDPEDSKS